MIFNGNKLGGEAPTARFWDTHSHLSINKHHQARKMQESPLMKPISNGDQWRELIREDDLPSLDQDTDHDLLLLLLKYKVHILLEMVKLFTNGSPK
ncbi:hypothetical protein ES288_D09G089600v1 [Gossypium darwinii]|uniref:Uncharacterized protein n=1 Tax=Gossypium darwinii TaxID=34276 RepID=A0A5D2B8D9_GOSDA|nr:hypothetical protein ES288_D09G089600v1 [Gossypium darwinii]